MHFRTDQFCILFFLCLGTSLDQDLVVHFQKISVFFVFSGKDDHFHTAQEVFYGDKSHGLVVSGIFDGLVRDHAADNDHCPVCHSRLMSLLIQHKISTACSHVLF